ncbi:MAG: ABC transporter ATP-binding protein [Gammaproteobacteria bacterium]|nr:ABC transporter ATP-binding protein [Gammaproteobacteria bacterium]
MLNLNKICFQYHGKPWLFSDLDWQLPGGKICGLLGKNGAGKSTMLKLISGLLFPQEGTSEVLGRDPQQRTAASLADIFYLTEELWLPGITAKKYLELFAPFYPQFSHENFKTNCQELEVDLKSNLHEISYGQKKKFLLAFALATNCKILLLDEPTNGLDIPGKSQFRKLAIANFTEDKTFIIATHQVHDLENLIDTVVMLDQGKIIFHQSTEEIAKQLSFVESASDMSNAALYQEKVFGGYRIISPNKNKAETQVDLELLFKAVLADADRINQGFQGGAK